MRHKYTVILTLIVVTLAIYGRAVPNDFVGFDDADYVYLNPHVQAGLTLDGIRWAFTTTHAVNWHPLTWLSHMADCQLYGLDPRGHHLTSILLHAANAGLLLLFLAGATGALWRSAFVAALFALHPLHVESVAWVAERKDVLSTFLFLLTLLAYARYVRRPGTARYVAVCAAFALGLMAKPMLVTLPCVLLLLDFWPFGRLSLGQEKPRGWVVIRRLILEKLPLFALSCASSIITFYAQKSGGAVISMQSTRLPYRIANTVTSYAAYLEKMVWPAPLTALYPLPPQMLLWQVGGAFLLLAGATAAVFRLARRAPYLPVGWLWYLGTLVPVIGLVQVGVQSMADRYTYIPLIGIFIMIAWGVPDLVRGWRHSRLLLAVAAVTVVGTLSAVTWHQIGYWKNSEALFTHALRYTSGNYTAHTGLGIALANRGEVDAAIGHYEEALRLNPSYELAHVYLAFALFAKGRTDEAIAHYREALRLTPDDELAHNNLGIALTTKGDTEEAIEHFAAAVRADPDYADAQYNLALALSKQGRWAEAVPHFRKAQQLKPLDPDIRRNLEIALIRLGRGEQDQSR